MTHVASGKPVPEIVDRKGIVAHSHSYGHFGIDKTSNIVQNHYWWWGLKDQVREHVKTCDLCKMGLAMFNEPMTMQPIAVQGIYHKVGIDMIGPLQTSLSGNKYIITAVGYMSKNIEAEAVPNKSSKTTAEFFYRDIVCRHGTPVEVVTDQGSEFQGEFQALLDKCGIDHRKTSPCHPQANGLTERANQTLTRSLVKMTKEDPDNWDKQIPSVLMGYRATRQASTKYSPFFVLHGHEMVLPINNKGRTVNPEHGELSEELLTNLSGPSQAALENVLVNIDSAQKKQMETYAKKQLHVAVPVKPVTVTLPATSIAKATALAKPVVTPVTTSPKLAVTPLESAQQRAAVIALPPPVPAVDLPSCSTIPVMVEPPTVPIVDAPIVHVKQEVSALPPRHKRPKGPEINEGDFIVTKVHKVVRKDGNRKGKLVPKAEGPYLVKGFTDNTKQIAIIADADDKTWFKRVADLSLCE